MNCQNQSVIDQSSDLAKKISNLKMADKTMCNENVEKSHSHNDSDQIYYSSALGTATSNASDEELRDVKKVIDLHSI